MKKVLCYCEMNGATGFGHYSRIDILLKILNLKKIDIITENVNYAKKFFKNHNIIKKKNLFNFVIKNIDKYDLLILDPPYYPNKKKNYENFSMNFKKIYNHKKKKFKTIWLTDETNPSPKYCDLLINDFTKSNLFKKFYQKYNKKIKLVLGIYSFLFQKEILSLGNKKIEKKHILIAFGGEDPKNLILKHFKYFKKINFKKIFITNRRVFKFIKKFKSAKNIIIQKKEPKEKFLKLLSQSKFYISTPSNIMFEAWSLGIPGNVIPIQNRQLEMGKAFKKFNIINLLPFYKKLSSSDLKKKVKLKFPNFKKKFDKKKAMRTQKIIKNFVN